MDVAAWLKGLGLGRYERAFRDNDIDHEVLPRLTAEDLADLGVTSIGHRRKLLTAVAALGKDAPPVQSRSQHAGKRETRPMSRSKKLGSIQNGRYLEWVSLLWRRTSFWGMAGSTGASP